MEQWEEHVRPEVIQRAEAVMESPRLIPAAGPTTLERVHRGICRKEDGLDHAGQVVGDDPAVDHHLVRAMSDTSS